jgi:urease accessory protein
MLLVRGILGDVGDGRFADRRIDRLRIDSVAAVKRRQRLTTDAGTDVAIDLDRNTYLREGAVLADDGEVVVVVERAPERALVIRLAGGPDLIARAVRLGHAFGNQHVPVEVVDDEIRVPITTSREIAEQTVRALDLGEVQLSVADVPLGRERPLARGHPH